MIRGPGLSQLCVGLGPKSFRCGRRVWLGRAQCEGPVDFVVNRVHRLAHRQRDERKPKEQYDGGDQDEHQSRRAGYGGGTVRATAMRIIATTTSPTAL